MDLLQYSVNRYFCFCGYLDHLNSLRYSVFKCCCCGYLGEYIEICTRWTTQCSGIIIDIWFIALLSAKVLFFLLLWMSGRVQCNLSHSSTRVQVLLWICGRVQCDFYSLHYIVLTCGYCRGCLGALRVHIPAIEWNLKLVLNYDFPTVSRTVPNNLCWKVLRTFHRKIYWKIFWNDTVINENFDTEPFILEFQILVN